MGVLDIFSKNSVGPTKESLEVAKNAVGILAGLDLRKEMDAHGSWKSKLQNLLETEDCEDLDVVIASGDCYCTLGKWLYGKGKALYGGMPEYETLRAAHANLHLMAGDVLTQHILGNRDEAEAMLKTKFKAASNRNQLELVRLFAAAKG
ncbi:MAG: CZB domain-containing protein [Methylophilaceae bacterium]